MRIIDLLKDTDARVVYGDKWLVVNEDGLYSVYQRKYNAKKTVLLITTEFEHTAIKEIIKQQE